MLDTLKVYNEFRKITETAQRCESLRLLTRSDIYYDFIFLLLIFRIFEFYLPELGLMVDRNM